MPTLALIYLLFTTSLFGQITIQADKTLAAPGESVTFTASAPASWTLNPHWGILTPTDRTKSATDRVASIVYTAPSQVGKTLTLTGTVTITADTGDGAAPASIDITLTPPPAPREWESRSVLGFQQAAASSSDPRQAFFLDFFIERGLDRVSAMDAKLTLWGNVRLESVPQQVNAPVSSLTADLGAAAKPLKINQLVQSAEFTTGLEWRLRHIQNKSRTVQRDIGIIAQYGQTGPLSPKDTLQIFSLPGRDSPQFQTFQRLYGTPPPTVGYVGFVNSDRGSFFKQYGAGFRVTTFDMTDHDNPPATFSLTVGQDQLVSGGHYHGLVGKFDVFYPLPLNIGNSSFKFIYLFGTVITQLGARPVESDPLVLQQAPAPPNGPTGFDSNVMLVRASGNRDMYRIGIGLDALSLLRKLKVTTR